MTTRQAACSCGQLTLTCTGEPVRVSICHCYACQRRTGSAFGVQARYRREQVTSIAGPSNTFVRVGDAGTRITFHFCPACGATVYWEMDGRPESLAIAAGAFADTTLPAPTFSVYEARKHPWVVVPDVDMEHMD